MRLESIDYKGYTIHVHQDEDPENPRDWDNLGTMVCFHKRYDLGDKHDLTVEEVMSLVKSSNIISLPLYLYDHSGIWMNTSRQWPFNCPWDSGQVGYIYIDKAKIRQEFKVKHVTKTTINKVINALVCEVDTYSKYISGDVLGYVIDNPENILIESCWGFYGLDEMIHECKTIIDADLIERNADITESHLLEVGC